MYIAHNVPYNSLLSICLYSWVKQLHLHWYLLATGAARIGSTLDVAVCAYTCKDCDEYHGQVAS